MSDACGANNEKRAVTADVPGWLQPLAHAASEVQAADVSRFLPPEDGSGRQSAVLIAVREGPSVLLIERAADMRAHAGQIAFPGGSLDPDDADEVAAALREANEEVGLDPASVQTIAVMPAIFIPVTGFVVTPVVAWWRDPHPVSPIDPVEVARAVVVPIAELADPANRFSVTHPSGWVAPGFEVDGLFIWGFTAGLLNVLLDLGGWAQPWDAGQRRPLPSRLLGRPAS